MKGKQLFDGVIDDEQIARIAEFDFGDVAINSKKVKAGDVFVCLEGGNVSGKDFVHEAMQNGASVIITQQDLALENQVIVEDSRKSFSLLCKNLNEKACDKLKIIGITGTNGKTTCSHVMAEVLIGLGKKVGIIGTLGAIYDNKTIDTGFTTPDPDILHKLFKDMLDCGVEYVVMEASAHAIALKKLEGIKFEAGILTNITQDHLDFFGDMDNYANTKLSFLSKEFCKLAVACGDDEYIKKFIIGENAHIPLASYGLKNPSDCFAVGIKQNMQGTSFFVNCLDEIAFVQSKLVGEFNVNNLLGVITACSLLGFDLKDVAKTIEQIPPVEGRFNVIPCDQFNVVIDYAHTPDGLENLLKTAKSLTTGKVISVFGCGGNRDKSKREIMGKVASKFSDHIILTSDNPRFEEPFSIVGQIMQGVSIPFNVEVDRAAAIKWGISKCKNGDTLVIAGKGAEDTQEINGVKRHFSDKEEVLNFIEERKNNVGEFENDC